MKKALLFILLVCFVFISFHSNAQSWQWMKGAQNGSSHGERVATDIYDNVYAAGMCWGHGNYGPYSYFAPGGLSGCSLVKYDSAGNIGWLLMADSSAPCGLTTDIFGNEYLLGMYYPPLLNFGGHTLVNPYLDSASYFIAKVNSAGNVLWMKNIGNVNSYGTFGMRMGNCITTDKCGNIYAACTYINHATVGNYSFSGTSVSQNILVAKYDSSGSLLWANAFRGNKDNWPSGISVTPAGNIYIAGHFNSDSLQFGTTTLIDTLQTVGSASMFIAKLDELGNPIWARTDDGGDFVNCQIYGLTADTNENAYVFGDYNVGGNPASSISFGAVTLPVVPSWQVYGFLVKYDSQGIEVWGKCIKAKYASSYGVVVDQCSNIWTLSANLDTANAPIIDTIDGHTLTPPSINYNPVFITGWSNSGNYITASALSSGLESSWTMGMACGRGGDIYITSDTQLDTFTVSGDSLFNTINHTPLNMYVAKYKPNLGCPYAAVPVCFPEKIVTQISKKGLNLFPNPVSNDLMIISSDAITNLTIGNLVGQIIYSHRYNSREIQVNVSTLPSGVYIIKINGTEVRKFVKE